MKIFERVTFPTAAIYNVKPEIGVKMEGGAQVEIVKNETCSKQCGTGDCCHECCSEQTQTTQ